MQSAPAYLPAAQLGVQDWERDGLIALVGPLSRGELRINMRRAVGEDWEDRHECGTVHCIGGWLKFLAGEKRAIDVEDYVNSRSDVTTGIGWLFYPFGKHDERHGEFYKPTAPQAAAAVLNFLVTGDPQWDRVMSAAEVA